MKKSFLLGIGAIAAASLLAGCADEWGPSRSGSGRISPVVGIDKDAATSRSAEASSRADGDEITAADLSLRLSKTDGSYANVWDRVADFSSETEFGVGEYLLEVFYGDAADEGFDKPYYHGEQLLTVADGKTTSLAITAGLANSMISIDYTDAFKKYMADWSATVKGTAAHTYASDETRPVYVTSGDVEVEIAFTKPNGLGATTTLPKIKAEPRHHYILTVDVNDGNVGDATLEVTFPDELEVETIEIDLSDKLLATEPPVVNADGFTPGEGIEMVAGLPVTGSYAITTVAQAQLKEVTLTTTAPSLIKQGWPEEINLLSASADMQAKLQALGLKALGLWHNPDMMAVLDFTEVLGNLKVAAGTDNVNTFSLVVKDKLGRASEPVDLVLNLESVNLGLSATGDYFLPGQQLKARLSFNGPDPAKNINFYYLNPVSGTDKPLEVLSVEAASSRAMTDYIVSFAAPELDSDITIKAECGGVVNTLKVPGVPFELVMPEGDVWSDHAYATIRVRSGFAGFDTAGIEIEASTDGGNSYKTLNATLENGYYTITDLTPGTEYTFRARKDDMACGTLTYTTEKQAQLPNNEMEEWSVGEKHGKGWWQVDYPSATADENGHWATMNLLTTSEKNYTTTVSAPACGYCCKSGTTPVSGADAFEGSTGALIQSVGWGSGNTAFSLLGKWLGTCQHTTFGELYLGKYNHDTKSPDYSGYAFTSRPKSMTFYTKYAPKNGADFGYAEIRMLDANGKVFKSTVKNITNTSFETIELPLDYDAPGTPKAARIVVIFKSSNNPDCLPFSTSNYNTPPSSNASTDKGYVGSQLYVDHILLHY